MYFVSHVYRFLVTCLMIVIIYVKHILIYINRITVNLWYMHAI